jgi:hypothetical protein
MGFLFVVPAILMLLAKSSENVIFAFASLAATIPAALLIGLFWRLFFPVRYLRWAFEIHSPHIDIDVMRLTPSGYLIGGCVLTAFTFLINYIVVRHISKSTKNNRLPWT